MPLGEGSTEKYSGYPKAIPPECRILLGILLTYCRLTHEAWQNVGLFVLPGRPVPEGTRDGVLDVR